MRALFLSLCAVLAVGCVPQDDPTNASDLRVLGMSFEPPEVMIPRCDPALLLGLIDGGTASLDVATLLPLLTPVELKVLIADPNGGGRALPYRLLGCSKTSDRRCEEEGGFVELASGTASDGELTLLGAGAAPLGTAMLSGSLTDGGTPLVFEVIQNDTFRGFGGIRVPVVLDIQNEDGSEHIYAQKLMVYSCQFFPEMKANVTPVLPGMTWYGEEWKADEVKMATGTQEIPIAPLDFGSLEEAYTVTSLEFKPVPLVESWKVNSIATSGSMASYTLGGTDIGGESERYANKWIPDPAETEEKDVTLYFVVRDGRGGESWITRRIRWTP